MKNFSLLFLLLICVGCSFLDKKEKRSIERSVFKDILLDLHELEGQFDVSQFVDTTVTDEQIKVYDSLFATKPITREEFLAEYDLYIDYYLEELDSIYEELIEIFEEKKDSIESLTKSNAMSAPDYQINQELEQKPKKPIDKKIINLPAEKPIE